MSVNTNLHFCPNCFNMLRPVRCQGINLRCDSCPFSYKVDECTAFLRNRSTFQLKDVDALMGGEGSWDNVDQADVTCPKCYHSRAYFYQVQTRSADEPMTNFFKCCNQECNHRWKN